MTSLFPFWINISQPRNEVPESLRRSEPWVGMSGPSSGLGPGQGGPVSRPYIREWLVLEPHFLRSTVHSSCATADGLPTAASAPAPSKLLLLSSPRAGSTPTS